MKIYHEIIIAGFGGQGVLLAGTILSQSALEQGLNTTWFPSYGAEMRGGTANSTVIISDDEVGSPIAFNPSGLIALNALSLDKFLPKMAKDAVIIANSSIINASEYSSHKNIIFIPISEIADKEIGNIKTANMVAVGALIKFLQVPNLDNVLKALNTAFAKKSAVIDINIKAVNAGYNYK
ncbi:2-oxoacid:acceptor oxidoreductase family protein [Elusimicrobiota bacterium]